jgi:peptidyl-prolyl cis-trans isomerase B (cyclophilin B)
MNINGCKLSISVDGAHAPQSASNFIALAKSGFYNSVVCHRLTTAGIFVLQCGDPTGTGSGGPGYQFGPNNENPPTQAVASQPGYVNYAKGVLAMANSGGTATQGSQFFIVYADSPLPPSYAVFGSVTSGIDKIQSLAAQGVEGGSQDGKPALAVNLGPIVLQ